MACKVSILFGSAPFGSIGGEGQVSKTFRNIFSEPISIFIKSKGCNAMQECFVKMIYISQKRYSILTLD